MFVAFCFNLSQINDGDLVYDNGGGFINFPLNGTRPNGTVASYSCNSGFRLNALDSTRICETGIWTGFDLMCLAGKSCMGTCMILTVCIYLKVTYFHR